MDAPEVVARWLGLGVALGASDLHLEPGRERWRLRARVDGVLEPVEELEAALAERVVARVKVVCGLLTYRTDRPQDGRVQAEHAPEGVEVRVATYPTIRGERVVLRFLEARRALRGLGELGLSDAALVGMRAFVARPTGALLVTGPAGSGKTTTMYAALQAMVEREPGRHYATIEDPVEIELEGVTQTEVRPAAGLDFPGALRALLRHDPEVMLVGEVRDEETAGVAIRTALTGHAVLGTVHAADAPGVFLRLLQMDVPGHLCAAAVRGVLSQRLARGCCGCAGGCDRCRGTGLRGRVMLDAWLAPDEGLRSLLAGTVGHDALREAARAAGWRPLRERGEALVAAGVTTEAELGRVVG